MAGQLAAATAAVASSTTSDPYSIEPAEDLASVENARGDGAASWGWGGPVQQQQEEEGQQDHLEQQQQQQVEEHQSFVQQQQEQQQQAVPGYALAYLLLVAASIIYSGLNSLWELMEWQ
jgi:hypothetical protein